MRRRRLVWAQTQSKRRDGDSPRTRPMTSARRPQAHVNKPRIVLLGSSVAPATNYVQSDTQYCTANKKELNTGTKLEKHQSRCCRYSCHTFLNHGRSCAKLRDKYIGASSLKTISSYLFRRRSAPALCDYSSLVSLRRYPWATFLK